MGLVVICGVLTAQSLGFDVDSVRPAAGGPEGSRQTPITTSPTAVTGRSASLLDCIEWAYSVREYQVVGPGWMTSELFDLVGKTAAPSTLTQQREMMRALLAARFHVEVHRETRELAVWALVPGHRGATLHPSVADAPSMRKLPGGGLRLEFRKTTIAELAAFLSSLAAVDRPVRNATGLGGAYDFKLDLHEVAGPWGSEAERVAAPSLSTVIREQLGLRMESRKDAVEVLVVDRVERPTGN